MISHLQAEHSLARARERLIGDNVNSIIRKRPGHFIYSLPHPSRIIVNGAWVTEEDALPSDWLADVESLFLSHDRDFSLYVPSSAQAVPQVLRANDYRERIRFPSMVCPAKPDAPAMDLIPVETAEDWQHLRTIFSRCFETSPSSHGIGAVLFSRDQAPDNFKGQLAWHQGIPVGMALTTNQNHLGVVDCIATLPEFRRQGFGRALTLNAMQQCRDQGASHCILHSSQAGFPLYQELGFREIGSISLFSRNKT